jgi:hypothetical protein
MPFLDSSAKARAREVYRLLCTHSSVKEEIYEEIKAKFLQHSILAKYASRSKNPHPLRCMKRILARLHLPDTIEENVIPLHDSLYKGSFVLGKVRMLLTEVIDRAEQPAFTTHVRIPSPGLKSETCTICLEAHKRDMADLDGWKNSLSEVLTSCGHTFGGNCLWTVRTTGFLNFFVLFS